MTDPVRDLAIVLGSKRAAAELLERTSLRHLALAPLEELEQMLSTRRAAARLHAALRLAREAIAPERLPVLNAPAAAYAHLYPLLAGRETERFVVVGCDPRNSPLVTEVVAEGSPSAVTVTAFTVFAPVIRHQAVSLICGHNHPSGVATPSAEDLALTDRLVQAAIALGIAFLDHIIVAGQGYASLLVEGALGLHDESAAIAAQDARISR